MKINFFCFLTLLILACNNNDNDKNVESESIKTDIIEDKIALSIENYICDLTKLTEKNGKSIIYTSCDGGNTELSIYKYRDTFFLLLYGGQEDDLFVIEECYKTKGDTVFFKVNYYGDNFYSSNITSKSGMVKYIINDTLKGTSKWFFTYLDVSYDNSFVSKDQEKHFDRVNEPCINCFEKEECEEFEKNELLHSNLSPLEQLSKMLENYKKDDIKKFNYINSKEYIKLLKKIKNIDNTTLHILLNLWLDYLEDDLIVRNEIVSILGRNKFISINFLNENIKQDGNSKKILKIQNLISFLNKS